MQPPPSAALCPRGTWEGQGSHGHTQWVTCTGERKGHCAPTAAAQTLNASWTDSHSTVPPHLSPLLGTGTGESRLFKLQASEATLPSMPA